MTFNEFLSEFKNSMKQYDRSNLIDDITVYTWVLDGISHFGLMPTINIEKIINIKNKKTIIYPIILILEFVFSSSCKFFS